MALLAAFIGALTASLLCLLVDRQFSNEPAATKHSHCVCGRELSLIEVVPVVPWLVLRGRARCCGARIPRRWPLLEAGLGLAWGAAWLLGPIEGGAVVIISSALVAGVEAWAVRHQRVSRS